jgi:hypothetical protein
MAEAAQAAPAAADDGAGFSGFTAPASTEGADNAQEAMAGLFGDTPGAEAAAATAAAGGADMGDLGAGRSSQVAARDAGHDGGADLFAQSEDGGMFPSGGGSDVLTSSPRVDIGRMTGTRNENSVLFSLSNLQALASDNSGAVSGAMPAAGPGGPTPGAASGPSEGSGLIDIRAMAAQVGEGEEGGNGVDDLLAIGGGGGFAPTLGAPVLMAQPAERSNKVLYGVIGVGAALFIGLVIILIVSLSGDDETAVAANQPTVLVEQTPGSGAAAAPGTGTAPAQHAAVQPTPVAASDDEGSASAGESGSGSQSGRGSRRGSRRRGGARSGGGGESGSSPAAEAPAAAPAPQAKRAKNDLDSLLDGALGGGGGGGRQARKKSGGGGGSNLPSKLSRAQVRGGMSSIQGRVRRCGNGTPGTVVVNVVISGSTGRVSSATVTGQFAGTAVGSCVARAVRGARFSRFRESNLTVRGYPFRVN